jgi:hypothetical protein
LLGFSFLDAYLNNFLSIMEDRFPSIYIRIVFDMDLLRYMLFGYADIYLQHPGEQPNRVLLFPYHS